MKDVNAENRAWMLIVIFSCVLMIMLLLSIIYCILIPAKHHLQQSYMMLNNIEDSFDYLNRRMTTIATQTDYLSMPLFEEESNERLNKSQFTKTVLHVC